MADISGLTPTQKIARGELNEQAREDWVNDTSGTVTTPAGTTLKPLKVIQDEIEADAATAASTLRAEQVAHNIPITYDTTAALTAALSGLDLGQWVYDDEAGALYYVYDDGGSNALQQVDLAAVNALLGGVDDDGNTLAKLKALAIRYANGAQTSQIQEAPRAFNFARHSSSTGIGYDSDGNWTIAADANGLWIRTLSSLGAQAGGPFELRLPLVSGTITNPYIQQVNGGANLNDNIDFVVEGDALVARTDAINASTTHLYIYLNNSGGSAAVIKPPLYTVNGLKVADAIGDPTRRPLERAQDAGALRAANKFRDSWTAAPFQGSGTSPSRVGDQLVIVSTRSAYATSRVSGIDHEQDITAEFRTSTPLLNASIEFIFAGGSPANVTVPLIDYGDYWGVVIPADTLTADPVQARFVVSNITSAETMHAPVTAYVDGFTVKNASRLSGHFFETWVDRLQSFRLTEAEAELRETLNRHRLSTTAAKRAAAQSNPLHIAQSNAAMAVAIATAPMWVDAVNGDDGNSGATISEPKQTWAAAYAATSDGDTIMLRNGEEQDYDTGAYVTGLDRSVFGWGDGSRRARIDLRQKLSGATWTNETGDVWKAEVTHREPLGTRNINPAVESNLFNFWLWFPDDVSWTYLAGSDSIADRISAVAAEAGSGFVHTTGSTAPDPRYESGTDAETDFTYYVHMPDGSDPNGQDIRIADRFGLAAWALGGRLQNLDFIGNARKDFMSFGLSASGTEALRVVDNCRFLDCPEHAFIGMPLLRNYFYAKGRPAPGTVPGESGRSLGSCANFYTAGNENLNVDISTGVMEVEGFNLGLFGHGSDLGSGVQGGFNSLSVPCLIMRNCGQVAAFSNLAGGLPFLRDGCVIDWLDGEDVAQGFGPSVTRVSGWLELEVINTTDNQILASPGALDQTMHLIDFDFIMGQQNTSGGYLAINSLNSSTPNFTPPTLRLTNCRDLSPLGLKGQLANFGGQAYTPLVNFELYGRTKIGALIESGQTHNPAGLTMAAGTEAGLDYEDRQGIIDRLTAAGKTVSIDAAARIVTNGGVVVSDLI